MFGLQTLWAFLWSWASVDIIVGIVATAVAVLEPKQLDAITDLRKWAIGVAVVAFTFTGLIAYGFKNGIDEKQRQWDGALRSEAISGEQILEDAVRDARADTPERMRNDSWNRDNWKNGRRP